MYAFMEKQEIFQYFLLEIVLSGGMGYKFDTTSFKGRFVPVHCTSSSPYFCFQVIT